MNWEESKCCTPLKRDFLREWFSQESRFFLTGGSALGLFHLDHRYSYDLDLFTVVEVDGLELRNNVMRVAARIGAQAEPLRTTPDFHRFRLTRDWERELLDCVIDRAPQLDEIKSSVGIIRVDTLREMVANKLTTLVSRSELKDIVDLFFLEQSGVDLEAAIPDARAKDGGWEPGLVSMLLTELRIPELPEWLIRPVQLEELRGFVERLRIGIGRTALPPL